MKPLNRWNMAGVVLVGTVICALLVGLLLRFGAREYVLRLLAWIRGLGAWGPAAFILIEVIVVIALLPGIFLTLGAGFLFGPLWGTVYVVIGHTAGGAVAFLLGRTLLQERVRRLLQRRPRLRDLDRRVSAQGWTLILLTRLIPFFPFKLSNYFFGVMRFSLRDMVIGTALGIVPIAATNVYAGSLAGDLATMTSPAARGPVGWGIYGAGLLILVAAVLYLGRTARRRLNLEDAE